MTAPQEPVDSTPESGENAATPGLEDDLSTELAAYRGLLDELQLALDAGDAERLEASFELASRTRRRFGAGWDSE